MHGALVPRTYTRPTRRRFLLFWQDMFRNLNVMTPARDPKQSFIYSKRDNHCYSIMHSGIPLALHVIWFGFLARERKKRNPLWKKHEKLNQNWKQIKTIHQRSQPLSGSLVTQMQFWSISWKFFVWNIGWWWRWWWWWFMMMTMLIWCQECHWSL